MSTKIRPHTTMGEILAEYPSAKIALFQRYHVGGCASCGYELTETLEQVRQKHSIQDSLEQIIACIHESEDVEAKLHVSPEQLAAAVKRKDLLLILDARSAGEYQAGHLPGAHHLTLELKFEGLDTWPKDTPIVFYSNEGGRSLDAASYFGAYGFTNVRSLDGGLKAWREVITK
ncbi:MAG TPA: rhodanese-like domain-containing protein [Acidobacteriota bacterium]